MSVAAALVGVLLALPAFTAPVVDDARRVPDDIERSVSAELNDYQRRTNNQVAVAVIGTTGDTSLEDYTIDLAREWGVGSRGADNGVLLLIALEDRRVRIEVGSGLEGDLTDLESGRIIRERVIPLLAAGDIGGAVQQGTGAIRQALGDDRVGALPPLPEPADGEDDGGGTGLFPLLMLGFVAMSFLGGRRRRGWGGGVPIFWGGGGFGGGGGGSGGGGGFSGGGGGGFSGGGASGGW